MKKTTFAIFMALVLLLGLASCDRVKIELQEPEEPISEDVGELIPVGPDDATEEEENSEHPYISITYGRDNPDNFTGRDMVFYTYDLVTKELKEECVIPFDSGYASGVVSKYDNAVYYSSSIVPGDRSKGNCLWVYDIESGKSSIINDENHNYNQILLLNPDTLFVMMRTNKHPIMPVLLDLNTKDFTYMADVNNEPFTYTSGATIPIYNYKTKKFTCIYWNDDEARGDYNSGLVAIDNYVALVSDNLLKDPDKIFTHSAKVTDRNMISAVQISDNELIVTMENKIEFDLIQKYYLLVFGEDETTFTEIDCPYPHADYVANLCTIDEGKTFYFYLYGDHFGNPSGIYSYDTESEELTPILLNDPETNGHYVNFSIVGPEKKEATGERKDSADKVIPEGYRKVDFEGCSILIGDNFYQSGTPVEEILPFENQLMGDDGENIRVIAEFLSAEDIADLNAPFAAADEKYAASINTVELSLGGFAAKKYHIQTTLEGPVPAMVNTIYYCIQLDNKMVTFAYYPVMGRGGLHTEDMEAILDTIRIS